MAVNKNFVVKNGLEVADNLIFAENGRVGVGTTNPTSTFYVAGDASVSGIITATNGFISVANTTPIQINLVGKVLTFNATGIRSTSLTLY